MSSKQEIKDLFVAELKNTTEYADVLNIKQLILNEIATPNIQQFVKYDFSSEKNLEQQSVLNMCLLVEFGFTTETITSSYVFIEMKKFLS